MTSETETKALRDEKEQLRLQIENLNSALHELGRENQSLQVIHFVQNVYCTFYYSTLDRKYCDY